ncbi:hypothetical protein Tco_0572174, partial [Tanacetum coccineum]
MSFPPLGEEDGTEGPMIIEAKMSGQFVHKEYLRRTINSTWNVKIPSGGRH